MAKHKAFGAKLQYYNGTIWVDTPQVVQIGDFAIARDIIEVTTHDSTGGFREYVAHLLDLEEFDVIIIFDPAETDHQYFRDIAVNPAATAVNYRVMFSEGTDWEFDAHITGFRVSAQDVDGRLEAVITFRPTGAPDFAPV